MVELAILQKETVLYFVLDASCLLDKFSLSKLGHFKFMLCESFKRSFSESKHPVLRLRRYARKQQTMYCVHLLIINNK